MTEIMSQIDIPAWGGFIFTLLASVVAVILYFKNRPKLDVQVTLKKSEDIKYPNRVERINLKIVSSHTTTIDGCELRAFSDFSWKTRIFGDRVVSSGDLGAFLLPKRLEEADVLYGWLDAMSLYNHVEHCGGEFRIDVYDTLHRSRPTKIRLTLPKDFKKTAESIPGMAHRLVIDNISETQMQAIAQGFHKALGITQLKCSFTTGRSEAQFEFLYPEIVKIDRIERVVSQQGGKVKQYDVR